MTGGYQIKLPVNRVGKNSLKKIKLNGLQFIQIIRGTKNKLADRDGSINKKT